MYMNILFIMIRQIRYDYVMHTHVDIIYCTFAALAFSKYYKRHDAWIEKSQDFESESPDGLRLL